MSDQLYTPEPAEIQQHLKWVFMPSIQLETTAAALPENPTFFRAMLDCIQDGVALIDTQYRLRYVNKAAQVWFDLPKAEGRKCYTAFRGQTRLCAACPASQALAGGQPAAGILRYRGGENAPQCQLGFATPVSNAQGQMLGVVMYIRDISFRMRIENRLQQLIGRFEGLELENEILGRSLERQQKQRAELEETLEHNITRFVQPSLDYIKRHSHSQEIELLQSVMNDLIQPLTQKHTSALDTLTSREMHIALLVKDGITTKEIAKRLGISSKTVDFHRANLRKKLSVGHEGHFNLRAYLEINL